MEISLIFLFIAGALGALAKDILEDNALKLPKKENGNLVLGSLGGMITGGMAGYFIDGNPTTAFLAGYAGTAVIENLLNRGGGVSVPQDGTTESLIRKIAKEECVDPDLVVRVARCESGLNRKAENINTDGSKDRGLFQINSRWHPEVSDEEAFDPIFSTKFFCQAFKNGNLKWWDATKQCWEKK